MSTVDLESLIDTVNKIDRRFISSDGEPVVLSLDLWCVIKGHLNIKKDDKKDDDLYNAIEELKEAIEHVNESRD